MVLTYKLYWYPHDRAELFVLRTVKQASDRTQILKFRKTLEAAKWYHYTNGWSDKAPDPVPYTCPYSTFPEEGLEKQEAIKGLLRAVYHRRYVQMHYNVHYLLPGVDFVFRIQNTDMPSSLRLKPEEGLEDLPIRYGDATYKTVHRTMVAIQEKYRRVFEVLHKIIPRSTYEVWENEKYTMIETQNVTNVAFKNIDTLEAMVHDFAQKTLWEIHNFRRSKLDRELKNKYKLQSERHKELFDDRYMNEGFLENPIKEAPTKHEEEKMNEPWVDEAISKFITIMRNNRGRHKELYFRRNIKDCLDLADF